MKLRDSLKLLSIPLSSLALAASAQAGLMGTQLQLDWRHPNQNTVYLNYTKQFTVSNAVEFPNIGNAIDADVTDTSIVLDFFFPPAPATELLTPSAFNGFALFDYSGTVPSFLSVTIDPVTNLVGFDASRISFDADHVYANFQSLRYNSDTIVKINVAVPEPSTFALGSLGALSLLSIVFYRRRQVQGQ